MPPFYIGSSAIDRIKNGYRGSVQSKKYGKIWKQEIKDHPNLFKTKIISVHSSREEATSKELSLQQKLNVVKSIMYINESFAQINGYYGRNNSGQHHPNYGKKYSDDHRNNISKSLIGHKGAFTDKSHSKKTKYKMSLSALGNKRAAGFIWITNGLIVKKIKPEQLLEHPGFIKGRKISSI